VPLLGNAALLMWCELPANMETEHGEWHSQEHFPERLAIPGFLRARRGLARDPGSAKTFLMYELANLAALTSPTYLERLNNPTPWTSKINLATLSFSRSTTRIAASWVHGVGGSLLTIRYDAQPGAENDLHSWSKGVVESLRSRNGVVGAHFFVHDAAATVLTKEHELRRKADDNAAYVLVVEGFDEGLVKAVHASVLFAGHLEKNGAQRIRACMFRLVHISDEHAGV